jgi:protoporphyrinogen oxidase
MPKDFIIIHLLWLIRSGIAVTLYESESRCGGHTLTDDSPGYPVDLGFQVPHSGTTRAQRIVAIVDILFHVKPVLCLQPVMQSSR